MARNKSKEKQLWGAVANLAEWDPGEKRLLQAICVIVAEAHRKPSKPRSKEGSQLPFGPGQVHERLLSDCSEHVNIATYDRASFGKLGTIMNRVSDPLESDLDSLVEWIQSGALDFWEDRPTWNQVIKHYIDWISRAREYCSDGISYMESNIR